MRPNVARKRLTYNDSNPWSTRRPYCYVNWRRVLDANALFECSMLLVLHVIGAAVFVLVAMVLPFDAWTVRNIYGPIVAVIVVPWCFKAIGAPPGLCGIVAFTALLFVASHFMPRITPHDDANVLGLGLLLVVGPVVAWTWAMVFAIADVWRMLPASLLVLSMLLAAMLTAILPAAATPLIPLHPLLAGGLALVAVVLARTYAGRLAASPATPLRAVFRLVDLCAGAWERRHDRAVPRAGYWWAALNWGLGGCLFTALLSKLSLAERGSAGGMTPAAWWVGGVIGVCTLLASLGHQARLWTYAGRAATGLIVSGVLWHTDDHPSPHVPGIFTATQLLSLRARQFLTFGFLAGTTWGLLAQDPALGVGAFRELVWHAPLSALCRSLECAVTALGVLICGLFVIGGPWLAYVGAIVPWAHAEEELDNQELGDE